MHYVTSYSLWKKIKAEIKILILIIFLTSFKGEYLVESINFIRNLKLSAQAA